MSRPTRACFSSRRASKHSWTLSRSTSTPSDTGSTYSDLELRRPLVPVIRAIADTVGEFGPGRRVKRDSRPRSTDPGQTPADRPQAGIRQ
jgi:hypothetical protein